MADISFGGGGITSSELLEHLNETFRSIMKTVLAAHCPQKTLFPTTCQNSLRL